MASAFFDMNDYSLIKIRDPMDRTTRKILPDDTYNIHLAAKRFVSEELSMYFDSLRIVMTHHAPSFRSVPEEWCRDNLTPCYVSSLDGLIEEYQPNLWVRGHLHTSADYQIGMTRIVCNPRGYMPDDLNPGFKPELVIEL